jgi:hypothetical protein
VWSDSLNKSLLFIERLNVNTDGTRRSYNVDDFWGQRNTLNNVCNAMRDGCAGLGSEELRNRRLLTQRAASLDWPAELLSQTKISSDIIPFRNNKPCPAVAGFLVSATSLAKPGSTDPCDINNYVDALTVPAIVIPKGSSSEFALRNAAVGDLVVTMTPNSEVPVFAVVGDTGPVNQLGEGSIALNGKLLGKTAPPVNYDEVRGRGNFVGRAWTVNRAVVLIFPGTRDRANPFMTTTRIDEAASRRFEEWGGRMRLKACAAEYERK